MMSRSFGGKIATAACLLLAATVAQTASFCPSQRHFQAPTRRSYPKLSTQLSSNPIERDNTTEIGAPVLQRKYETFVWEHNGNYYNINYRAEGPKDGPPVLLVHGFGASVNHFRYQFPALSSEGYRVYAIDLLGFGASDKPKEEEFCIELWTQLLVDFVQEIHSEQRWVIGGNSIGGLCSLGVAAKLNDLVRGCVLFNCAGGMTGFRYEELPWALWPVVYFFQKVVMGPRFGGSFFESFKTRDNVESILLQQGVYRDRTNVDENLIEMLLAPAEDDGAKEVFLKVFSGPAGPTPESILPNVECPILALWGDSDPWTPVDKGMHPGNSFQDYARGDFELVVLEGTGHCPHDERPEAVSEHLLPWMANL